MDRSREEGRLEGDVHLDVDVRAASAGMATTVATRSAVPLLRHEPDERAETSSRRSSLEDTYARIAIETIPM